MNSQRNFLPLLQIKQHMGITLCIVECHLDCNIFHKELSTIGMLFPLVVNAKVVNDFKSKLDQHWNHEVMYEH